MLGRSQINIAPILGVLLVMFVGFWPTLRMETINVPRMLDDECECIADGPPPVVVTLHADGSIDLDKHHVEAPGVAAALADLQDDRPDRPQQVLYVQADDGVRWGDFVDVVSSVRHITGGEVAVVSVDE